MTKLKLPWIKKTHPTLQFSSKIIKKELDIQFAKQAGCLSACPVRSCERLELSFHKFRMVLLYFMADFKQFWATVTKKQTAKELWYK